MVTLHVRALREMCVCVCAFVVSLFIYISTKWPPRGLNYVRGVCVCAAYVNAINRKTTLKREKQIHDYKLAQ